MGRVLEQPGLDLIRQSEKWDKSHFPLHAIAPAPENALLYDNFAPGADDDDLALYESIRADGIREPLHISADHYLLSGHRRYAAARYLGLTEVPCIVVHEVAFSELSTDERLELLATYNRQREKSHAERLREALVSIDPEEAYDRLLQDRAQRQHVEVEENVTLGQVKRRARITTRAFLAAAQRVIRSEREYWPMSVRRIHYLLLNDPPLRHDRKRRSTYRNDRQSYKALTNLLLRARLTGDVPYSAIDDQTRPIRVLATYQHPADYIKAEMEDFLRYYARDLLRGQANHVEILVEKNALRKHVETVADEYCIPCTTGVGFSSLPPRQKMVRRFQQSKKARLVLLILSDFDPDGEAIAESFPRSLRDDFGLTNVLAHKVALSGADLREYGLPSDMEAKTGSKNYRKFVERHGVHVAELDAAPVTVLQTKLRDAIESVLDMEVFRAEVAQEADDCAFVTAVRRMVVDTMRDYEAHP